MYQRELKVIDTQEKAYLLGQLWGDGCNSHSKSYKICLASNIKDIEVYKKLAELFPFLKYTTYSSHPNMIYLINNQKALFEDLKTLGMLSSKTKYDKTGEFHFPNISNELIPHFIRGYFDADGCAWYPSRRRSRNNLHIEFGCSTKNFLLKIKEILDKEGIEFSYVEREKTAGNNKKYMTYTLFSSNKEKSKKFAEYIYKNANIFLDYKHFLCYKKEELIPSAFDIFGECPYCKSKTIRRHGTRGNKQRLKCLSCNKQFSKPLPK